MNLILMVLSGTLVLVVTSGFYALRRLEQSLQMLRVEVCEFRAQSGEGARRAP